MTQGSESRASSKVYMYLSISYVWALYVLSHNSAVRATQKLYRTSLGSRDSREPRTVSFADRVSHPVDPPRRFLHVLRAGGSAQNGHSPEHSESAAHAVNQN